MRNYTLSLPEDESIILSGSAVQRLVEKGDGDAALLYIVVLRSKGVMDERKARADLKWSEERFYRALNSLSAQGLVNLPEKKEIPAPPPLAPKDERLPEYTLADLAEAMEDKEFSGLKGAVEHKLGKKLTTPDTAILLGLHNQLGLPSDVIYLLVSFCEERIVQRYGEGRQPTMRQIEKEGYVWARLELLDQESAAAYIRKYHQSQEALPRMMRLLRLGERKPSPGEEKFLMSWISMGFEDEAIEFAYDKTIMKCKDLKWGYMNTMLSSWNEKGLHTLEEVQTEDKRGRSAAKSQKPTPETARDDRERMQRYRQKLRREMEES